MFGFEMSDESDLDEILSFKIYGIDVIPWTKVAENCYEIKDYK